MSSPASRRLPGIRVTALPAPIADALPRMDIAAFVGFAASGPVHLPVAVEDTVSFARIFGDDAPLAFDAVRGDVSRGLLGPAVRLFFANGGRRCWIVRVADEASLVTSEFTIPGTVAIRGGDDGNTDQPRQARLRARAPGSWADDLGLRAVLRGTSLQLFADKLLETSPYIDCAAASAPAIGDMLRFTWLDGTGNEASMLHCVVAKVVGAVEKSSPRGAELAAGAVRVWLADFHWTAPGLDPASLDASVAINAVFPDGTLPATMRSTADDLVELSLGTVPAAIPRPGDVIRLLAGSATWWFCVASAVTGSGSASPPAEGVILTGALQRNVKAPLILTRAFRCDHVALDLTATSLAGGRVTAESLGCARNSFRYAGALPDDQAYFAGKAAARPESVSRDPTLGESGPGIRFPLAGEPGEQATLLPLFFPFAEGKVSAVLHGGSAALLRDGLAQFTAPLFVDPVLAQVTVDRFMDEADAIRYLNPTPRRLTGLHAVLGTDESPIIDEVTLVAIPDAVLPGWAEDHDIGFTARPLTAAPASNECPRDDDFRACAACSVSIAAFTATATGDDGESFELTWSPSDPSVTCVVEEATRDDFADSREIYSGAAGRCTVATFIEPERFYRVRPDIDGGACGWAASIAIAIRNRRGYRMLNPAEAPPSGPAPVFPAVHRALLRMCAGRGDIFAALSLPEHFRAEEALRHSAELRRIAGFDPREFVPPLSPGEERALSYGALYHPWLYSNRVVGGLEQATPDAAACAVMAARAIARGAWIAPANESLRFVVGLRRPLPDDRWPALAEARVNVVRADPRGFMALTADTLSLDPDFRPINVRRLLILLRRIAYRRGVNYVFEPNGDVLRRSVERAFEAILTDLFERGAFAGKTPESAFRVDCGAEVNPPASVDLGRFIVELRVAPSLPMEFITVLLVQTGGGLQVSELGGG